MTADRRIERAVDEHRLALRRYLDLVEGLGEGAWRRPWSEAKWTTAEVTEHLVLFYEVALRELRGEAGVPPKVGPGMARLLRWFLLPHMLFHRTVPIRVRAPREVRPVGRGIPRAEMLRALEMLAARFETEIPGAQNERSRTVDHPYFGPIRPLPFLRFSTVHLEHHYRQVASLRPAIDL